MSSTRLSSDLWAALVGVAASAVLVYAAVGYHKVMSWAECHGETTPYLGSGRQAHVTPWCLAKDEGPLIGLKKQIGIYDPNWKIVIR